MPADNAENRAPLPGPMETQLAEWAQAETCPGGRADEALLSIYSGKIFLGYISLGWFRQHTSMTLYENAIKENRREDAIKEHRHASR